MGAYIGAVAGELAQKETNAVSMTASDTVRNIGKVIGEIYGH
jgi:NAD(P)H-hydrate repair Nnr-like enzyme with NAD(P)H-hydrate dehydratase domain